MALASGTRSAAGLLNELGEISEMIHQDTHQAAMTLEKFKTRHQPIRLQQVKATADLLTLLIASIRNDFDKQAIDHRALTDYFLQEEKYDEAAQVMLARARHFFTNGNLSGGEEIVQQVRDQLLDRVSPRVQVVYLTRLAFIHGKKNQYEEKMAVSLQALDKLKAMGEPDMWHRNIITVFYTQIAFGYMANADFERALPYLQQSLAITELPGVSTYNRFNVYSYFAVYYEELKDYRQSTAWYEKVISLLKGDALHQAYLLQTYLQVTVHYHLLYRDPSLKAKERQEIEQRQKSHIRAASALLPQDETSGPYLLFQYASAMFAYQNKSYARAAALLGRCLPQYIRMKHDLSVRNCYRLSHEVYYAWGKTTSDPKKLLKAYEMQQKEGEMIEAQSQQSHLQKMEAAQVRHALQQEELTRKLLQQQVEAVNKEIQLTTISLQEKIKLLDELKDFLEALKKQGSAGQHTLRTIIQKIGATRITEQEKAMLQQKMDEGNHTLFKLVADAYPALTPREVHACGLIKTGLSDKELSRLFGSGERGYEQLRHRIKKKMELSRKDNLVKHLMELSMKGSGL